MSIATEQVPAVYRRRIGEVLVTAINDGSVVIPAEVLQSIDEPGRDALLHAAGCRLPFSSAINVFVLQWPGRTVLVDAGVGAAWGPAGGRLPAGLAAAGMGPQDIDAILMTHLHVDHIGGLLDEAGQPAFPRAELFVPDAEMAHWQDDAAMADAPEAKRGTFELVRRTANSYADRLRRFTGTAPLPGVAAIPLPGHTPGHTGYSIQGGGETLVIWGDICHVPDVQCARPDVTVMFDSDPAQAIATRRAMLARAVAEDLLVAGMHMSFPGFCRIAKAGEGYAIQPESWRYTLA